MLVSYRENVEQHMRAAGTGVEQVEQSTRDVSWMNCCHRKSTGGVCTFSPCHGVHVCEVGPAVGPAACCTVYCTELKHPTNNTSIATNAHTT